MSLVNIILISKTLKSFSKSFENKRRLSAIIRYFLLVCIDKIPKDEHERCPLCGSENFSNGDDSFRFNCSSKWQFETQENPRADCKGYNTSANRKIEDICKATCNNCGKYVVALLYDR